MKVCFADLNMEIDAKFPRMESFARDYLMDEETDTDFNVSVTMNEIDREDDKMEPGRYSKGYLETLAIQRKIAERLPFYHRFLMHGAVIAFGGRGYMFTAVSGTGKSTHIRLWKEYLGEQVQVVNGDKPFLNVEKEQVLIYGTPWAGKEGWHTNVCVPLGGICFLCRGEKNRIRKLLPQESLERFLVQMYMPENIEAAGLTLELLDQLLQNVPLYLMECDISENAVQTAFEGMTGLCYEKYRRKGRGQHED